MTWREDLRRVTITVDGRKRNLIGASFRGVAFFVEASDRAGGRRVVTHEFPLADDPFVEDLGRRARKFKVDGYVIGDDYLAARDALCSALEDEEGPGELVHPYHGVRVAICENFGIHESRSEGGYASFSIDFNETPAQAPTPSVVDDPAGATSAAADAAATASDAEFLAVYSSAGLPGRSLASAEAAITKAAAGLKEQLAPVINATQEAAGLTAQAALITAEAASLVRSPALIMGLFRGAVTALATTALDAPGKVLDALTAAYSVDLGSLVPSTTATRAKELANQVALQNGLRRVMLVEAVRLAPLVPFVTIDDATATRDELVAMLDEQAAAAGDTAYPALVDLRAQLMRAVPGGQTFARVVSVSRPSTIPSLLLTYQLYGSVDLELDVVARNDVKHPGFIAGDLKVLSDG
ncbi:MAG TPA: DNA circularization N-terminal domain-containing protein [Kofleriaceae bacterium]